MSLTATLLALDAVYSGASKKPAGARTPLAPQLRLLNYALLAPPTVSLTPAAADACGAPEPATSCVPFPSAPAIQAACAVPQPSADRGPAPAGPGSESDADDEGWHVEILRRHAQSCLARSFVHATGSTAAQPAPTPSPAPTPESVPASPAQPAAPRARTRKRGVSQLTAHHALLRAWPANPPDELPVPHRAAPARPTRNPSRAAKKPRIGPRRALAAAPASAQGAPRRRRARDDTAWLAMVRRSVVWALRARVFASAGTQETAMDALDRALVELLGARLLERGYALSAADRALPPRATSALAMWGSDIHDDGMDQDVREEDGGDADDEGAPARPPGLIVAGVLARARPAGTYALCQLVASLTLRHRDRMGARPRSGAEERNSRRRPSPLAASFVAE